MNHKINEAASDMFRANLSRFGQGIKNVLGAGNVTTDSKDKGVETLFLRFKEKFDKITPSTPTITPTVSTSTTASIAPPSSVTPPTTGATGSSTGSSSATSSATGSVTGSSSVTGSTSSESRYFLYAATNLLTPLIKIYKQPTPANLTISGSHPTDYRTSPIVCVTSSAFNGNIDIRGLVNGQRINNKYLGKESKGALLTYWIKPEYINIYTNISASENVAVSYRVLYSDNKTTPAAKNGGISYATTLTINPKRRSIVPEGIINEALNTEQQELYLDFLKDLSWYFKIQPNPDMSTYNPEKVLEWMKTQGERFKYIVDYLDQKLGTTAPTAPTTATSGSSDVNEQLKKELDIYINEEFLTNLSIIYPEKILDSKLKDNDKTRMSNSSKTLMAFKIEGNKISSLQLKFNSKNIIRFTLAINSTAFKAQEPNLFTEVTIPEIARLSKVFKTKLFNTLTFRYVNNTSLSGGKSFEELKNAIEKYLTPRVDAAANKMTDSIRLTLIYIIKENNKINDVIFVGINNKGIKFIISDLIPENKLFKINDSKNKNIFKLR
jgi:hypothetical protein